MSHSNYCFFTFDFRTFDTSLTSGDINKFIKEDEMKYLIIEHSSGKYFALNLLNAKESSTAFSIVQDKFKFMVMGWKVAKAIPTWVLGFSDWNN
jgi:hypothetical protein